jgi:branched-chain amino acid transport system ATP-binding protein
MILEIKDLHAGYGELKVLNGIDMVLNPSEIVAIIGPNGAGKSTVLKSIFSITDMTKGKIIFKGKDITDLKTHELLEVGISFVPQGKINFSNLSIEENLRLGAELIKDEEVIQKNMGRVYEKFPALKQKRKKLAYSLSGGQAQMLAIGRALMQNPDILLMDEPSLGLSPKLMKELFKIIKSLKEDGISIMIVEQNAKKAIETADRTYLLEDGIIALEGKDIIKHKKIQQVYLGGRY